MSERCWLALVDEMPASADAAARVHDPSGTERGWLAAWLRAAKPVRAARRADPRIIDADGAPATISLVWPALNAFTIFDDPAVQGARRAVLADAEPANIVTTLLVDASHFGGSLTARRGPDATARLRDDPFRRVAPARIACVEAGLLGVVPPPCGPVIERHGSDVPWPGGRFAAV